jgi:hypothetical protein
MNRAILLVLCAVLALTLSGPTGQGSAPEKKEVDKAAVDRTRKTVRMLDDVYKTTIVLVTDRYVHSEKDYPAGRAAVKLFGDISKKGWHEVRIIDATGQPSSPSNVAKDNFDREGIKQLKGGKDYYEEVIQKDGKSYLRAITPVPVVMDKCVMCHANYKTVKKGEPIGALTYTLPIE